MKVYKTDLQCKLKFFKETSFSKAWLNDWILLSKVVEVLLRNKFFFRIYDPSFTNWYLLFIRIPIVSIKIKASRFQTSEFFQAPAQFIHFRNFTPNEHSSHEFHDLFVYDSKLTEMLVSGASILSAFPRLSIPLYDMVSSLFSKLEKISLFFELTPRIWDWRFSKR